MVKPIVWGLTVAERQFILGLLIRYTPRTELEADTRAQLIKDFTNDINVIIETLIESEAG